LFLSGPTSALPKRLKGRSPSSLYEEFHSTNDDLVYRLPWSLALECCTGNILLIFYQKDEKKRQGASLTDPEGRLPATQCMGTAVIQLFGFSE